MLISGLMEFYQAQLDETLAIATYGLDETLAIATYGKSEGGHAVLLSTT